MKLTEVGIITYLF